MTKEEQAKVIANKQSGDQFDSAMKRAGLDSMFPIQKMVDGEWCNADWCNLKYGDVFREVDAFGNPKSVVMVSIKDAERVEDKNGEVHWCVSSRPRN
ncbi:MAG: hypothetical protein WC444_04465 [Candidatus Paceibacterota bacterium]